MKIERLESRWVNLFRFINKESIIKIAFDDLVRKYSEKHRFYHRLDHVEACLGLLDEVKGNVTDFTSIETAIWLHDVIYEPRKKDNEEKSAEYTKKFLKSIQINSNDIEKIERLILLTKHPSNPEKDDEKYLIDIDLSILGGDVEQYNNYELWIRKEYAAVSNYQYKKERAKVLLSFSKLNNIYQTDYFYSKYEVRARDNIDRALHKL